MICVKVCLTSNYFRWIIAFCVKCMNMFHTITHKFVWMYWLAFCDLLDAEKSQENIQTEGDKAKLQEWEEEVPVNECEHV